MQRLTAGILLVFALAGTVLTPALQATVAPSHLCCRRTAEHRCHNYSLTEPGQTSIRATECPQDCRRAVATLQWAHPQASRVYAFENGPSRHNSYTSNSFFEGQFFSSQSTRAPSNF